VYSSNCTGVDNETTMNLLVCCAQYNINLSWKDRNKSFTVAREILSHSFSRTVARSLCDAGEGKHVLTCSIKIPQSCSKIFRSGDCAGHVQFHFHGHQTILSQVLLCILVLYHANTGNPFSGI